MMPRKILENMGVDFIINDPNQRKCDAWFILDDYGINEDVVAICPPDKIFFVMGETEHIHIYNKQFVKQFHNLITCQHIDYGTVNTIFDYLPSWFIGLKFSSNGLLSGYCFDYDNLVNLEPVKKSKLISVVSSNKKMCKGHEVRLSFVEKLKDYYGSDIDFFGRGISDFSDKWDVLSPYKYHIALENNRQDYYITEKIMDPYLAFCFPIYYGALNVDKLFSKKSFAPINIYEFEQSIKIIDNILSNDIYIEKLDSIIESRMRVLNEHNIFVKMAKYAFNTQSNCLTKENVFYHESEFLLRNKIINFFKGK